MKNAAPPDLESLLVEVETAAANIMAQAALTAPDAGLSAWALDCCRRIRDALTADDAAVAAIVGCQLGERLSEIRNLGDMARRIADYKPPVDRAHGRDTERRREYFAALTRGFSTADACKKAAAKFGVSPKTIMRAVNGH